MLELCDREELMNDPVGARTVKRVPGRRVPRDGGHGSDGSDGSDDSWRYDGRFPYFGEATVCHRGEDGKVRRVPTVYCHLKI